MKAYEFSETELNMLRDIPVPLCVFQRVGWKYRVIAVSDGYYDLIGVKREAPDATEDDPDIRVYEEDKATLENMFS